MGKKSIDMLTGSLPDKIILFALPFMATSILQQFFNTTDAAIVGRFASSQAMAAVGVNSPVVALLVGLFTGLSIGANVVIGQCIGSRKLQDVHDAVMTSMVTAIVSGFLLVGIGMAASRSMLTLMQTPSDILEMAVLYLRLFSLGAPFIMIYNFGAAVLRSKGDSKRPLYCLMTSGVFNLSLNMLFVIVFHMGVVGVAVATVIANALSCGMILWFLFHEEDPFRIRVSQLFATRVMLRKILWIGVPAGLQGMVFAISNIILQSAVNGFGSQAAAGSVAAQNFEYFSYFILNSFVQAAVTFTAQNYGKGDLARCREVFRWSMVFGVGFSLSVDILFTLLRYPLLGLFTTDPEVISFGVTRMCTCCIFNFMANSYEITGGTLRGLGHSMLPTALIVFGSCLLRIFWVFFLFPMIGTFQGLLIVYPISWAITGILVLTAYAIVLRRLKATRE